MSTLTTRSLLYPLTWPGIAYLLEDQTFWPELAYEVYKTHKTEKAYDVAYEMISFNYAQPVPEGQGYTGQSIGILNKTETTHVTYGIKAELTFEAIDDNLYLDQLMDIAEQMNNAKTVTIDFNSTIPLNFAFDSTQPIGDGLSLINSSHITQNGTYSNSLPNASLTETSVTNGVTQINTFPNSAGIVQNYHSKAMIVHPTLWFDANRLYLNADQPNSANRNIGVIKVMNLFPEGVLSNPYLSNVNSWYLTSNCPNAAVMYQKNMDEVNTWMSENNRVVAMAVYDRYSFAWLNARGIVGSQNV